MELPSNKVQANPSKFRARKVSSRSAEKMTLPRNIFRPWDEPATATGLSMSGCHDKVKGSENPAAKPIMSNSSSEKLPPSPSAPPTSCGSSPQSRTISSANSLECAQLRNPSHRTSSSSSSFCESVPRLPGYGVSDPASSMAHYGEPASPPEPHFPFHSDCPSNLFLYPLEINELANLSRNELTAIGLLPPEPPSSLKTKRQRPKRFHCPHCQVAFSNNGQLRGHIRIHTGERPFVCEHDGCGKSFTRNEELTRHRRIHTGLRPFPCSICGKKFGRKDHLKKHTRTHQRVMYAPSSMIGYGGPFQAFHPPMLSSQNAVDPSLSSLATASAFGLSLIPSMPHSHYPRL